MEWLYIITILVFVVYGLAITVLYVVDRKQLQREIERLHLTVDQLASLLDQNHVTMNKFEVSLSRLDNIERYTHDSANRVIEFTRFIQELPTKLDALNSRLFDNTKVVTSVSENVNALSKGVKNVFDEVSVNAKMLTKLEKNIDHVSNALDKVKDSLDSGEKVIAGMNTTIRHIVDRVDSIYSSIVGDRGKTGEQMLLFLLERLLLPGEYEVQASLGPYRVDVLLKLNIGEDILRVPVDSKFTHGKKADVKKRIEEVSKYVPYSDTSFALMYVPSDSIYLSITSDEEIVSYAFSLGVYIVGPTALYAFIQSAHTMKSLAMASKKYKEIMVDMASMKEDIGAILSDIEKLLKHSRNMNKKLEQLKIKLNRIKEV